jgi:hypothetical protein
MFPVLFFALAIAADPLAASQSAIDAGEVRVGPPLVRRFSFSNTAAEPLTITEVKSSCGCLAPKLSKRVFAPGERGELAVEVNTLSQPVGQQRWAFTLSYHCGGAASEQTFALTARLFKEVEISPAAVAFQGDGEMTSHVTIVDRRPRPLRVQAVTASAGYLKATGADKAADGSVHLALHVAADCPEGRHAESVSIMTDDPDYPEIKLPVTILRRAKQRVVALPARATLVAGGSALVQLRAADGTSVRVEAIEPSTPAFACRWAAGPAERATVRIGLDRSKWDGRPFTGEVRVRLAAPAGETVVIPVSVRLEE